MGILSTGYTGKLVKDADGKPTSLDATSVKAASVVDGAIGGITGLFTDDTIYTGIAKTAGELTKVAIAAAVTSKYTTGSFIPRKAG